MTAVMIVSGIGFVVALYMTLAWRMFMARQVWRAGATMKIAKVSAYHMALMNGGVSRVALTGVVRLLGSKALVAGISGVLTPNDAFRDALDSVEREAIAETKSPAVFKDFLLRLETRLKRSQIHRVVGNATPSGFEDRADDTGRRARHQGTRAIRGTVRS